ncbi:hypothetical protein F511_20297 [Dorcoceras hygrometricum]|uniref:Uncharacterized protein n=1 Tax=Dorcoceras hygrometricum TaxID=472368 RepID=A0A2Z7CUZ8_9LAMI|nr:hypothetical protein F511_20297 [Dorcoceras hygrometricum]
MSLFDLQDVCIAIGSLATLDLPMVVDLIGIYGLKGHGCGPTASCIPEPLRVTQVLDSRFPHRYSAQCVEHEKRILGVRLPKSQQGSNRDFPMLRGKTIILHWGIQLAVGPQPLWLRNHNSGLAHRIMVKRLATSPHDPLGITDSAFKNQLVVVSVQYGPFNPYIPIRSTTIGKSRVAIDPIAMHTSWRSNSDIASVTSIGYPRMSASGESSTTMNRLLHASGSYPIPTPYDPKTNRYNQDIGLIPSTNGNHLESPNEGSSIDHQVTIYLHAQNITMFPTIETWYFASQILVSNSGGLILILTVQSTRNMFRIHSDY